MPATSTPRNRNTGKEWKSLVGEAPSTLHLIYPEVYLNSPDKEARIARIQAAMKDYLGRGLFREVSGMIYVERETAHGWRRGLLFCLDLEAYDYNPRASSLIRATEGTIIERIPPRVKIREGAVLEVPHIMILIDDPGHLVIGPAADHSRELSKLYEFELMFNSGRLRGFLVDRTEVERMVMDGLSRLASPEEFQKKYGLPERTPLLLFAVGDGNHSLATAKTIWERTKAAARNPEDLKTLRCVMPWWRWSISTTSPWSSSLFTGCCLRCAGRTTWSRTWWSSSTAGWNCGNTTTLKK